MRCLNPQFIASCRSRGLDEGWLKSLANGPQPTRGTATSRGTVQRLAFRQVIRREGRAKGGRAALWGPGKFYQEMLGALR